MISIIIASGKKELLTNVSENIGQTIGVEYEIISFDNSSGSKGLCELYNLGTKRAKFELLCFMHEDILIETIDWGKKVASIFSEHQPGILGVAGSKYKSYALSGWCPPTEFGTGAWRVNVKQGIKYTSRDGAHDYYNPDKETLTDVVCLDGVWFCTTKEIAEKHGFDDVLLKGFHGYDIDFSINVGRKHRLMVTYDILLYHASEGNFNTIWLKELIKVHQKWVHILPVGYSGFDETESKLKEDKALKRILLEICRNKDFSLAEVNAILKQHYLDLPFFFFLKIKVKTFYKRILN